jgi:hydrogenase expression/formation protein HypC
MCLGVPGRVVAIWGEGLTRTGRVDFGGVEKEISLAYVPEVEVGDYTLVHVGVALARVDERSARETLALLDELDGALDEDRSQP